MFKKLSRSIGLTETEIKVLLFLAFFFLAGLGYHIYKKSKSVKYKVFDYSKQDSLFEHYTNKKKEELKGEISNKKFDSKQEVLDFKSLDFKNKKIKPSLKEKSININTADVKALISLPGIGEKTAQKIISLRNKRNGFKNLKELIDVKGIGISKFNKIKKFLYIE